MTLHAPHDHDHDSANITKAKDVETFQITLDPDGDGIVWPSDTFAVFRQLKFNILLSFVGAALVHLCLSFVTRFSVIPDPFFRVYLPISHGGDTQEVHNQPAIWLDGLLQKKSQKRITFMNGFAEVVRRRDSSHPIVVLCSILKWTSIWLALEGSTEHGLDKHDLAKVLEDDYYVSELR